MAQMLTGQDSGGGEGKTEGSAAARRHKHAGRRPHAPDTSRWLAGTSGRPSGQVAAVAR